MLHNFHITESIQCPGFYLCARSQNSDVVSKCIPYDVVCDGNDDCILGDDEIECGKKAVSLAL